MSSRPFHLLLMEDEPNQARLVERSFSSDSMFSDCEFTICEGLTEARAVIEKNTPNLILADFNLADGNVLEFLESQPSPIPFPVVVLTAQGDEELAVAVMKAGALDYSTKSPELFRSLPDVARRALAAWDERLQRHKAEQALRESESRLQDFFDSASDLIQLLSPEGDFLFTNRAWRETIGYTEDELAKMKVFEIIHPDCGEHCMGVFKRLMSGEDVGIIEVTFVSKSGERIEVEGNVNVRFEDGKPVNTRGIFRNITEKKQADRDLQGERDRAQRYLDTVQTIMLSLNSHGEVEMINHMGCSQLGYALNELIGVNWFEQCIPEDIREGVLDGFQQIMRGEMAATEYFENEIQRKDGTHRLIAWHHAVLRNDNGAIVGSLSSGEDITERKQAELKLQQFNEELERMVQERSVALKASEQRFRAMFTNSVDGILVVHKGMITTANPAFVYMLSDKQSETETGFVGRNVSEFTSGAHQERLKNCLQQLDEDEAKEFRLELPLLRTNGVELISELHASRFDLGDDSCALLICRDITERREAEQRLMRSQRMESIGTLAGGVAHDLNNTLSPILMGVDMLRPDCPDDALEDLDLIENSARRGAEMVRQLLSFAKGTKGDRVPLNLKPQIREIEQFVSSTIDKSITMRSQFGSNLSSVIGDGTQFHQLILNLCVNARDAMPEGGIMTVSAENAHLDQPLSHCMPDSRPGDYVKVSVADTGTGIPPDLLERIFDPFFTTKDADKGTGLGLATVIGIVKGHDGFLHVTSEMGSGTRFDVYFPISRDEAETQKQPRKTSMFDGSGKVILIAEDEAPNRRLLTRMLSRMNFELLVGSNGREAWELYQKHAADITLAITDIRMPVADGLFLIGNLQEAAPELPVIAMTGLYDEESVEKIKDLGVTNILTKPFSKSELVEVIQTIVPEQSA